MKNITMQSFTDDSLKAVVECSVRYLPDRFLPDKAIDLIDEAEQSKNFKHVRSF